MLNWAEIDDSTEKQERMELKEVKQTLGKTKEYRVE